MYKSAVKLAVILGLWTLTAGCSLFYKAHTIDYAHRPTVIMRQTEFYDLIVVESKDKIVFENKIDQIKEACKELGREEYILQEQRYINGGYLRSYQCVGGMRRKI